MHATPYDRRDRTLAEQLSGAFTLFGVIVAGAFVATALAYLVSANWLTPEFDRSRDAVRAEAAAYTAMLDEETGARAYLLTHDVRFLEPYIRGERQRAEANDRLTEYVGSVATLGPALLAARLAEERWHERWGAIVTGQSTPFALPSMSEGKDIFDAYRVVQAEFAARLRAHRDALAVREGHHVAARVVLELLVFIAILVLAVRQHRALRDSIVAPVAALLCHIERVRDGELTATVDPAGPRELRQLGEGLNDMVRALAVARAAAASRDEALREHSVRLRQILAASREFSESLNLTYVVGAVRESTAAVGGYECVFVWLMDHEQKCLVNAESVAPTVSVDAAAAIGQGLAGRAAKSGRTTFESPGGEVRFSEANMGPVSAIAIPLIVGARVVGALEARNIHPRVATREVIEVLEMLATHAATAIESARLHEVIEQRSQVDPLTHLLNRRRLDEDLDAECKRSLRYSRPLAFVMLDVDHFKAFNDAHGHPQADKALQEVADVIVGCARTTDTTYRYGGEEFCIILRETTAQDAMHFAERVRQRIEQRFVSGGMAGITASFGVAEFTSNMPTPRALVEAADSAMYEAKHAGRNKVSLSAKPLFALNGQLDTPLA